MVFFELSEAYLDDALTPAVSNMYWLKMKTSEIGLWSRIDAINNYLDSSNAEVDQMIQAIPNDENVTWAELNKLFLKTIGLDA